MLLVNILLLISSAFAGGTMKLTGEIHGFTEKTILVSDGQNIYTLSRDKVFNKLAKNLKRGELVDLSVDVEGILETQEVKKN